MKTLFAILGCAVQTSALAWTLPPASQQPSGDAVQRQLFEHAFVSHAAPARTADEASVVVTYDDLDLSKPTQAALLYARLRHAARTVCPPAPGLDLGRIQLARDCYATTLSRAVRSIDLASFTSTYDQTTITAARAPAR